MSTVNITATVREPMSRGANNRLRKQGFTPGVLYGGAKRINVPIQIPTRELAAALEKSTDSAFLTLQLDGGNTYLVLPREIQYGAIKRDLRHIDLQIVERDEEVRTTVPVRIVGTNEEPLQYGLLEIEVKGKPADLPGSLNVDVSALAVGDTIFVSDLEIPAGVELISNPEDMVVGVVASTEAPVEEAGEEVAEDAAGEPEATESPNS
ncbi:MAG: 50S ribosomal protein L25 [Firmicutes bacterium]|nr:50S ribosomal protein L25 [Bacillota bacterium]